MNCPSCGREMRLAQVEAKPDFEGPGSIWEWECDACRATSKEGIEPCAVCGRDSLDRKYDAGRAAIPIRLPEGCTACVTCNICGQPLGALPRTYNAGGQKAGSGDASSMWSHLGCIAKQREVKWAAERLRTSSQTAPVSILSNDQTAGATILTLGILSLLCFGVILGPIAWYMGSTSLALIESGRADSRDLSIILAGRALGIIGTILAVIGICIWALYHGSL